MTAGERIELPGLDPTRSADPAGIVEVAARTLAVASDAAFVEVERLLGLDRRVRRRRSPFALRALALALEDGRLGALHDLRAPLPLAADQDLGTDSFRYHGFFQDAPVATYHSRSANTSRWDVHHLWHAVQGFVWWPAAPRGVLYAGARLDEAACETHWFFLEGMLSPRCEPHLRFDLAQTHWPDCPQCDASTQRAGAEEARDLARGALRFWGSELASLDLFFVTHRVAPNPMSGHIDNWIEAFRYLQHHERRLRSPAFAAWVERCLTPGLDYETGFESYRDRVSARLQRLLVAPLAIDLVQARIRQARRILQDVASRLIQAAHAGGIGAQAVDPVVAAIAAVTPLAYAGTAAAPAELERARCIAWEAILAAAADPQAHDALCLGYDLRVFLGEPPEAARPAGTTAATLAASGLLHTPVTRTLAALLPRTSAAVAAARSDGDALARAVVALPAFAAGTRPLDEIAVEALADDPPRLDLVRYERLTAAAAREDRSVHEDLFAADPARLCLEDSTPIRLNPSLQHAAFDHDVVELARGGEASKQATHVWWGARAGRPLIDVCNELFPVAHNLKRPLPLRDLVAPEGPFAGRRALVEELLRRGLLVALDAAPADRLPGSGQGPRR